MMLDDPLGGRHAAGGVIVVVNGADMAADLAIEAALAMMAWAEEIMRARVGL